jgi:hypothetical protein
MTSSESKAGEGGETGVGMTTISVCSWNVNNRVGKTTFRPEAAEAAMETVADVLVFNEFFPGRRAMRFDRHSMPVDGCIRPSRTREP